MDAPTATRPAPTVSAIADAAMPAASLPWERDWTEHEAAPRRLVAAQPLASRPRNVAAPVPWSVVALAALTAAIVIFSSQPGPASQTRELLPVMVAAPIR